MAHSQDPTRDPNRPQDPNNPQVRDPKQSPETMPGRQHEQQEPGKRRQPGSDDYNDGQNRQRS